MGDDTRALSMFLWLTLSPPRRGATSTKRVAPARAWPPFPGSLKAFAKHRWHPRVSAERSTTQRGAARGERADQGPPMRVLACHLTKPNNSSEQMPGFQGQTDGWAKWHWIRINLLPHQGSLRSWLSQRSSMFLR